jgi:hypothetical protein
MTRNMGSWDRGLRTFPFAPIAIAVGLILGAGSVGGVILFAVAGIMLVSSATAFCPIYTVVGISTCPHGVRRVGHRLRGGHAQPSGR